MDDHPDPLHTFFPANLAEQDNILYTTLELEPSATAEDIRKAYRRLALQCHPDKHAGKDEAEREEQGRVFQRVGFAYAVLSDEGRRKRYDATGRTDENAFAGAEEMGWDAYFETLFKRVDRKVLDEDKKRYQGSEGERSDLIDAYTTAQGSFPRIISTIPHSSHADEARFITLLNGLIASNDLPELKHWRKTSGDTSASAARGKAAAREAKEAEKAARELGVWEEFYGDGSKGARKGDAAGASGGGKGKSKGKKDEDQGGGEDALAALILKRQRSRESGLEAMAEKYRRIEEEAKAKRGAQGKKGRKSDQADVGEDRENEPEGAPDISDADFEALQAKMFGGRDKDKASGVGKGASKGKAKGKKGKA